MTTGRAVTALILVSLAGCGEVPDSEGLTRGDSAGISIVEVGAQHLQELPDAEAEEVLRIGSTDGPAASQFFRIAGIKSLAENLVVLDGGNRVVRVFSREGDFIRQFGGDGEGPGLFLRPYGLAVSGDTIAVLDVSLVHLFNSSGDLLRAFRPQLPDGAFVWTLFPTQDHWMAEVRLSGMTGEEPWQDSVALHAFDMVAGQLGERVYSYAGKREYFVGAMRFNLSPILEDSSSHAIAGDGEIRFVKAPYEVHRIDQEGKVRSISRVHPVLKPISDEVLEHYRAFQEARVGNRNAGGEAAAYAEALLDLRMQLPIPAVRPVIGRVIGSQDGEMLLERVDERTNPFEHGDTATWDVVSAEGIPLKRINLPGSFEPFEYTGGAVTGVENTERGVEQLVSYAILDDG